MKERRAALSLSATTGVQGTWAREQSSCGTVWGEGPQGRKSRRIVQSSIRHRGEFRRRIDLQGLTLAEAEAQVAALIDDAQQTALEDFEISLADLSSTEIDRQIACRRAELETVREELLVRLRAFVKRGGKRLQ